MDHVTFVIAVVASFSCLFAVCMSIAALVVRGADSRVVGRIPFVVLLALFMLSDSADLYLANLSLFRQPWVYEIQEIALALLIPALSVFVVGVARRRCLTVVLFGGAGAVSVAAYVTGNFVAIAAWPYTYPVYGTGSAAALIAVAVILLVRRVTAHRIAAVVTLCLASARILATLTSLVPAAAAILPAIATTWGISISAEELRRLVRQARPAEALGLESAYDRYNLSERERQVTRLLITGKRYHEIGEALFISKATVKTYVLRVYAKFEVNSKMELVNRLIAERG